MGRRWGCADFDYRRGAGRIELVADLINAGGGIKALGGAKINLVVSDATSSPATAPTVARRLITQNELTAVLGHSHRR